jgi:chitin disaccharide deacetylase
MNIKHKLIVHADDYGLAPSVSKGILSAHVDGIVSSTSILINSVTEDEIAWLLKTPSLDTGIHLTLTSGSSVLPKEEVSQLVDSNGFFFKKDSGERPLTESGFIDLTSLPEAEILTEFEAQLYKSINLGIKPSHLDSHHHIHSDPKALSCLIYLAQKNKLAIRSISESMCQKLRESGIITNDYFEGRFFGKKFVTVSMLTSIIRDLKPGITELMCHPGEISNELKSISGYTSDRENELEVLKNVQVRNELSMTNVELIGWRDAVL